MEQIKAPTARDLRSFGGSAERYYEVMRARLAAEEQSKTPGVQFAVKLINAGEAVGASRPPPHLFQQRQLLWRQVRYRVFRHDFW